MSAKPQKISVTTSKDDDFVARIRRVVDMVGGIAALSRKCHLSRPVIHKYLNGASDPSRARLVSLAQAAGVSVEWLATGAGTPETATSPLSPLDADTLRNEVRNRVDAALKDAPPDYRNRCVDLILPELSVSDDIKDQMVTLGVFLAVVFTRHAKHMASLAPPPLSSWEEEMLRLRTPLFRLWRWRQGGPPSLPETPETLSPASQADFQAWCETLRPLTVAEIIRGIWRGDGAGVRSTHRFFVRPSRVFRAEQIMYSKLTGKVSRRLEGFWSIHDDRIVVIQYRTQQTDYLVTESDSGRSFCISFEGESVFHSSIIPLDPPEENTGMEGEIIGALSPGTRPHTTFDTPWDESTGDGTAPDSAKPTRQTG